MAKIIHIGIPWYEKGNYDACMAIMLDREKLLPYHQWLAIAQQIERKVAQEGKKPIRAIIDPGHFVIWCKNHGTTPDAQGRILFANVQARQAALAVRQN